MNTNNLIKFEDNRITLKYETESLIYEKTKNLNYSVGTEYISFDGDRYFLKRKKS